MMSSACADLFVEARCRDAWKNTGDVNPADRIGTLIRECSAAYCPLLADPKPALCTSSPRELGMVEAQQQQHKTMWAELIRRIQILDLGTDVPADARIAIGSLMFPIITTTR
jgi:hypothetical protein